jgi:hypothetical protein
MLYVRANNTLDYDLALTGRGDLNLANQDVSTPTGAVNRVRGGTSGLMAVGLGSTADFPKEDLSCSENDTVVVNDWLISIDLFTKGRERSSPAALS